MTSQVRRVASSLFDFARVAYAMRPDEREQWCAFRGLDQYDPEACARDMLAHGPASWTLIDQQGQPFFVGGFTNQRPGVWTCWAAGTPDGWAKHWRTITRVCRSEIDILMADSAHRIEIISLAVRTETAEWYVRGLGMTEQALLRGYAADGRDAICYARTAEKRP